MENNGFLLNEDMLWDYADGLLSASQRTQMDAYLLQHPEYAQQLRAIQATRQELKHISTDSPRAGFADKVMAAWVSEQIDRPQQAIAPDRKLLLFPLLMGAILLATIGAAVFTVIKLGVPDSGSHTLEIPVLSPEPLIAWLKHPFVQIACLAIICLAFWGLLDRYLRLWLHKKAGYL